MASSLLQRPTARRPNQYVVTVSCGIGAGGSIEPGSLMICTNNLLLLVHRTGALVVLTRPFFLGFLSLAGLPLCVSRDDDDDDVRERCSVVVVVVLLPVVPLPPRARSTGHGTASPDCGAVPCRGCCCCAAQCQHRTARLSDDHGHTPVLRIGTTARLSR